MTITNLPDDDLSVENRFFRYFSGFLPVNLLAHVASSVKPFLNERAQKTTPETRGIGAALRRAVCEKNFLKSEIGDFLTKFGHF